MDSTFDDLGHMGDEPSPICSLPPPLPWVALHSNWVLQKVDGIHDYVGISCEGFEEQFKALLIAIEAEQPFLARSSSKKERELKRLACSINYDVREGIARRGRHKDRANNSDTRSRRFFLGMFGG